MDLQQHYDMFVVPSVSRSRREIDAGKTMVNNIKELPMDTLPLVRERRKSLEELLDRITTLNMNITLDPIPQWLRSKSLEVQERYQSSIETKVRELDQQIEVIIARENALREARYQQAEQEYALNMKPVRDLAAVKQGLIDQGFETAWSNAGYAPKPNEYVDISNMTLDECYDKLAQAPMPPSDGFNFKQSPYEFCTSNVALSCCILGGFCALAITPFFNILAIAGIIALFVLCAKQIMLQKEVTLIFSILSGFNLSTYLQDFIPPEGCEPVADWELDTNPLFEGFEEKYMLLEEEAEQENINEFDDMLQEFEIRKREFEIQLNQELTSLQNEQEEFTNTILNLISECNEKEKEIISSFKRVGERRTNTNVFKHNLALGFHEGEDEIFSAEASNVIVTNQVDDADKQNLAKIFVANLFSNIGLGLFNLYVYDPHTYGAPVMAMYNDKLYSAITFEQSNIDAIMTTVQKASKRMYELSGGSPIEEYNEQAAKLEKVPATYNFVMILSDVEAFTKKEAYVKFAESSYLTGTYFWVFSDKDVDYSALKNFKVMNTPYPNIEHPMKLTIGDCNEFASSYGYDLEKNNKPKGLKWKDFINNVCPPEKIWTWNADNEVKICPGYTDGDPTKVPMFELGNTGNVHGLAAGATGSGKSVFLNHLITTACMMYSPAELQLCLCDFKGSEFGKYIAPEGTSYILPHIKNCLCTADGDFAASLFSGIESEGRKRYAIMQKPAEYTKDIPYFPEGEPLPPATDGAKNWNRYWRSKADQTGNKSYLKNIFPRILVIVDEFQNIFENAEPDAIEVLIKACTWLAKVGRASNINTLLSSQSLTGTLSDDVLAQMTLRLALRCNKEVSNTLLGTNNAATIKYSFGFLYATATGIPEDNQPFIKTPYLEDFKAGKQLGDVAETINLLHDKLAEIPYFDGYDVTSYLEVTKHPIEQIDEMFATYGDKLPKEGLFFTGAPMTYTTNKLHNNFVLARKNNTHIMSCFGDNTDFVLFFRQLMRCIKNHKTESTVIINSQVQDMTYLCDAEDYVLDKHKQFIDKNANCPYMITFLERLYESRKDRDGEECTPVYIFLLGWDKGVGICIDADYELRGRFTNFLQVCGEKHIHVIMINQTMMGVNPTMIAACKYHLAGKCSLDDSMTILGSKHAAKSFEMQTGWVFSHIDGKLTKSKLYVSEITKHIEADNVFI